MFDRALDVGLELRETSVLTGEGGVSPALNLCLGSGEPPDRAGPEPGVTRADPPEAKDSPRGARLPPGLGGTCSLLPRHTGPGPGRGAASGPRNLPPPLAFAAGLFGDTGSLLLRGGPGSDAPGVC